MSRSKVSNYQDFGLGGRDCEVRYQVIKKHLPHDRQLAVLDVGSNMGYFSISIARDFSSLVYSVEHRKEDYFFHIQKLRQAGLGNNYVFRSLLNKRIVAQLFNRSEVFDVTLLLSVAHHFHYPFEEWSEMVGSFVRHSRLTFFELPSLEDEADIAAIDKFRSWYSRFASNPYEPLLQQMLKAARLDQCTVSTIRGALSSECSKNTRHILLVTNEAVSSALPRFHCLSLAVSPGFFLVYPGQKYWEEQLQNVRLWCRAIPLRIRNRLGRTLESRGTVTNLTK